MTSTAWPLPFRTDALGIVSRQRAKLAAIENVLCGDLPDPAQTWRARAAKATDPDAAEQYRQIARVIEELL